MELVPLNDSFGVEIVGVDPRNVTPEHLYPEIRAAFEAQSLLLFRRVNLSNEELSRFARLFGPLEQGSGPTGTANVRSNATSGGDVMSDEDCFEVASARANQLWHTDRIYFETPALANFLTARVVPSSGGETEIASTRVAWRNMPDALRGKLKDKVLVHHFAHSRGQISDILADHPLVSKFPPARWRGVWRNPENGEEALYIASHTCGIDGMHDEEARGLIDAAIEACTQPQNVYSHAWEPGDLLIWDERATLHRGRPWPYSEPRTLVSTMVLASASDGIAGVKP